MTAAEVIIQKISDKGPISFHDFMELSLYHPTAGYYTSPQERIGMQGDYYTSPVLSPVFGEMVGRQLEEMWAMLGKKEFTVVEYGAGTGQLCFDILEYAKNNMAFYDKLTYCIIEKSGTMRHKEKLILPEKVRWFHSIRQISEFSGCVLSNELLDNFSVHQVVMQNELMEVLVDYNNGFHETYTPASEELKAYLKEQHIYLPGGYRTEINLLAGTWIKEISVALQEGFVMTIDYGFTTSQLYNRKRSTGTVMCYHKHNVHADPFQHIGEQDITAHVNFSALHQWGIRHGLHSLGLSSQGNFLRCLGITDRMRQLEANAHSSVTALTDQAFKLYTLLLDLGNKMKVMIQRKGTSLQQLTGMGFAQQLV